MAWSLPESAVLGFVAGQPEDRSGRSSEDEVTSEFREAMLLDLLDTWDSAEILAPGGRRVVLFAPEEAGPWFDARVPASFALQAQDEGPLGARMEAFLAGEIDDGATRVVLVGSAAPTLDPSIVISAFLCLEGRDLVLGPSADGGCYLVGCRATARPLFDGEGWFGPEGLEATVDRLRDTGLSLAVLPPWYRADTPEGWRTLAGHVRALRRAGMNPGLPRVESLIAHAWD
jgi:glycosyltransferase A (GT-A) superfamily protein (DUF2064 family)